ncbi:MAG: flavin reductase family protein [Thermofilaceae archaeon]|nr:flavin reductase family protein [Thermofilaceae archaeon]MCX8179783.1 flavin reductase family protein [Thermofilaceae archaeon]MDW8004310.1 flavin reductase family protein [Thermofilaceae archaeon]
MKVDPFEALDLLPQPLVIVTAGEPDKPGARGGMTAAWVSRVSWDPPMLVVAMTPARYTLQLIKEKGCFAVNVVGKSLEKEAYGVFGSVSGREVDKFEKSGVKVVKAECITAPVLAEAVVALECRLEKLVEAGDHVLVVGRVVCAQKLKDEKPLVFLQFRSAELK